MASTFITAVLGGAVGAILTQAATFFRDWWNKREEGKFTALTLALSLEAYASECTEPIFTLSNYVSSKQNTGEPSGAVPVLPEFSDKTNWRSIGVRHAADVLGFRVKVSTAHGYLQDVWEFEGRSSTWGAAEDTAIELGSSALDIAQMLRRDFALPPMPKQANFDVEEFFREKLAELTVRRADYAARNKEVWSEGVEPIAEQGG